MWSWVIGDHGGDCMRNPGGCMPRIKGMQAIELKKVSLPPTQKITHFFATVLHHHVLPFHVCSREIPQPCISAFSNFHTFPDRSEVSGVDSVLVDAASLCVKRGATNN